MICLLERQFEVAISLTEAWQFLADLEKWPRWARHIRRIEVSPAGGIGPHSSCSIYLRNGTRSTFRMQEFRPMQNWKWSGPFLWLTVHYDHRFDVVNANRTKMTWVVDAEGFGVGVFGRIFAVLYSKNLDKAIPALISAMDQMNRLESRDKP